MKEFLYGLKKGIPIALGYLAVSFSFGVTAKLEGISPIVAIIISATNVSSAGQLAGIMLIARLASFVELFLTVFLINIRYALMSLSLSQKLEDGIPFWQKLIMGYGVTDEIYAMAITETRRTTFKYMMGLTLLPVLGWVLGTTLGVFAGDVLPGNLISAMGIGLYAMFIAIIIPDARRNYKILIIILIAVAISCGLHYIPVINTIGIGFKIIIATVIPAIIGAIFFPVKKEEVDIDA